MRPASPKYDERSFFYTTPAAFKPAALSGRPQTQWATEGTFLGAAPQRPNPQSASQAAGPLVLDAYQQPQQQQQQQQEPENQFRAVPAGMQEIQVSPCTSHKGSFLEGFTL